MWGRDVSRRPGSAPSLHPCGRPRFVLEGEKGRLTLNLGPWAPGPSRTLASRALCPPLLGMSALASSSRCCQVMPRNLGTCSILSNPPSSLLLSCVLLLGWGGQGEAGSAEVISSYSFDVECLAPCSPHPGHPQRPTALWTGRVGGPIPAPAEAGSFFQAHVCRPDGVHDGVSGDDGVSGGVGRVRAPGRGGEAERRAGGM